MNKNIYNEFYRKFGESIHLDPERFMEIANLCKGEVLDVGCGTGDLADFYDGFYAGIDISDVAIKMANTKERKNANFFCGDITKIKEDGDNKFDTIVLAEILEHLKDDKELFKNLEQWVKPNSRIIITVPNGDRIPIKEHVRDFTVPQLRKRFSEFGKVKFYRWRGFEKRILMTIDLGQKNDNMISLVMIAKNEAQGLENAILSTIDFVDNIVISIDCWSEDDTLKIAERYADTIKRHEWKDDFAKARNFAQEGVKTKWTLCIDGHEYIEKFDGLDEILKEDVEGLMVKVKMENTDAFWTNRIFRSFCKWKYPIHNSIVTKTIKKYKGFIVRHNLTKGQKIGSRIIRTKQRTEMMPRLLKKELKENKKSARAIFYLARWYFTQRKTKKALRMYKKYMKLGTIKGELWYCCWEMALCANALGKHLLALNILDRANTILPNRWEISRQKGLSYMCFESWKKAIIFLTDSFKINKEDFSHNPEKRDNSETWDLIGFCYFQLKEYQQAKIAWQESLRTDKKKSRIKLNKRRIELIDKGQNF